VLLRSLGEELQLRIPVVVGGLSKQSDLGPHGRDGYAALVDRRTGGKARLAPSPSYMGLIQE
jgi:hypothetical protein